MRPGPLAVCPSARPRGQASSPSPPLPASGLSLPPTPAVPSPRAYLCRASPRWRQGSRRPAGKGEGASSSAPTRLPAARARPRVSAAAQPGRARAGPPPPRPPRLPPPSQTRAEPLPRRTYLLAPRGAARRRPRQLGAPRRRDKGRGGSRRSLSTADRAPPAAGEGARRVSAGRDREEGKRPG